MTTTIEPTFRTSVCNIQSNTLKSLLVIALSTKLRKSRSQIFELVIANSRKVHNL